MPRYEFSDGAAANQELEAAIIQNPDDQDAWAVYGDWLQSQEDPRGECIALSLSALIQNKQRSDELLEQHKSHWLGELTREALTYTGKKKQANRKEVPLQLEWFNGFLRSVWVGYGYGYTGPKPIELLKELLVTSSAKFLQSLTVGMIESDGIAGYQGVLNLLEQAGPRPSLRELCIGDFDSDECEISWSEVGDVGPLLKIFPNLERLILNGGEILLSDLSHETLRELRLTSGGLPGPCVSSLSQANLPALETLEVWFGAEEYGAGGNIQMLKPFFQNKNLSKLKHLGLQNSEFQHEIVQEVIKSPLLPHLESLDFSLGTLSDKGARILLDNAEQLKHIKRINITENYVSAALTRELTDAFAERISVGHQDEPDDDGEEAYYYVSVGE